MPTSQTARIGLHIYTPSEHTPMLSFHDRSMTGMGVIWGVGAGVCQFVQYGMGLALWGCALVCQRVRLRGLVDLTPSEHTCCGV